MQRRFNLVICFVLLLLFFGLAFGGNYSKAKSEYNRKIKDAGNEDMQADALRAFKDADDAKSVRYILSECKRHNFLKFHQNYP